jgi:hypothetical protein
MELPPGLSSPVAENFSTVRCGDGQTGARAGSRNFGELRRSVRYLTFSYDKVSRVRP